jgi:hypothetical protein
MDKKLCIIIRSGSDNTFEWTMLAKLHTLCIFENIVCPGANSKWGKARLTSTVGFGASVGAEASFSGSGVTAKKEVCVCILTFILSPRASQWTYVHSPQIFRVNGLLTATNCDIQNHKQNILSHCFPY